jgi:beta-lactamase regulating signal transducer with metallopeptidase domain/HEAT repeat protein
MTVQIVGWTLIHSLWQGALIAALLGLVLLALRKAPAAWRHTACLIALIAMPVMPLLTSLQSVRNAPAAAVQPSTAASELSPAPGALAGTPQEAIKQPNQSEASGVEQTSTTRRNVHLEALFPWIVGAWLIGVLLLSLRVIAGFMGAHRLVNYGTAAVSAEIAAAATRIAQRIRVSQTVRVLASVRAPVPMVIGFMRPVVLMPVSLLSGLTLSQIEAILAHELAHVRRYDYAFNVLQTVLETLFFYHPAIWWLSKQLRDEREHACDELAVSLCGDDPIFYSRVLLTVEQWRGERISFAPAATGGSLALRIRKLIGEDERRFDVGPRWFAGVITVVGVLLAGSGVWHDRADAQTPSTQQIAKGDTTRARPSSIDRFTGTGDLAARWNWANETARRKGAERYWIGYVVAGSGDDVNWFYLDRNLPVQVGDSWFSGHMRFNGEFSNMRFSGIGLRSMLGDYAPQQHAVFVAFDATSRRTRLVRVHLANFVFPMHFDRMPLFWLDEVNGVESIRTLASLEQQAANAEVWGDLAAAIGAHADKRESMPILVRWMNDRSAPHELRVEAVEALAYHESPEALTAIVRLARSGEHEDLRAEAVEALQDMPLAAAADTLMNFARTLDTDRLRREAVESLGERKEPHIAAWLEQMARSSDTNVGTQAIEALANMPDNRGAAAVTKLALDKTLYRDTRIEAIESIADIADVTNLLNQADHPIAVLERIIFDDPDLSVQIKATESLGDIEHSRVVTVLQKIVASHPQEAVQIEAAETLADSHDHAAALSALQSIATGHPNLNVRMEAIESLGNFSDDASRVVEFLKTFLASNAPTEIKLEALEALSELPGKAAEDLLETYARSTDRQLRAKAAELVAER